MLVILYSNCGFYDWAIYKTMVFWSNITTRVNNRRGEYPTQYRASTDNSAKFKGILSVSSYYATLQSFLQSKM